MENSNTSAFPVEHLHAFDSSGLTKREYACIKLGIPETGDEELDELIRKSEHKRIAIAAMNGLLANNIYHNPREKQQMISVPALAQAATSYADAILSELSKTEAK